MARVPLSFPAAATALRDRRSGRGLAALSMAAFAGLAGAAGAVPGFDVHFVVLTGNPEAHRVATVEQLRREVDILNRFFVTERREPLVRFRFKSAVTHGEARDSACALREVGDQARPLDTDHVARLFNACDDPRIRDGAAINFYVYDAYAPGPGFRDATGHGRRNGNRPFVFLDWRRLNHGDQAAEEHEMGHAFGLGHECVPGATRGTSTNIMASADCGKGGGGLRDLGFNGQQAATILQYARQIAQRLHESRPRGRQAGVRCDDDDEEDRHRSDRSRVSRPGRGALISH